MYHRVSYKANTDYRKCILQRRKGNTLGRERARVDTKWGRFSLFMLTSSMSIEDLTFPPLTRAHACEVLADCFWFRVTRRITRALGNGNYCVFSV